MAANRRNAALSHGPVSPAGKAQSAAANLLHGYYSQSTEVALTALGEDPAEYKRRLESLIRTWEAFDDMKIGLVVQLARALWRVERYHRVQESMAVQNQERMLQSKGYLEATTWISDHDKVQRLKNVFYAADAAKEGGVGIEAIRVLEKARGDLPEEKAFNLLTLLLRLREPAATEELLPWIQQVGGAEAVPVAEGEDRRAVSRELVGILAEESEATEKRLLEPDDDPDAVRAQFERDEMLAVIQPKAAVMTRAEESSLRQVLRITHLLINIKKAEEAQKNIKYEG